MPRRLIPLICAILLLAGCQGRLSSAQKERTADFFAMDTYMTLTVYGGDEALLDSAHKAVEDIESRASVTLEGSEIYDLNHTGRTDISGDTYNMLSRSLELCAETGGTLDISVYPVLREWGFTTQSYQVPEPERIEALLEKVDYTQVELSRTQAWLPEGFEVDLGSVAKGYTGDRLAKLLKDGGVSSAILALGGNIQTIGSKPDGKPWRVAVQDPYAGGYVGVVEVSDKAVVTSGGYERYFEDDDGNIWWHIIDPSTGYPAKSGLVSVTVISGEGIYCDALSTALFVMGRDRAVDFWRERGDFDMVLLCEDGTMVITPGIEDSFTPTDGGLDYDLVVADYD